MNDIASEKKRMTGKLLSIQAMRAFAALSVVTYHVLIKLAEYGGGASGVFSVGASGVDLFFIISGFIMFHVTSGGDIKFGAFMRDRVVRIMPLYWVLSCLALVAFLVAPQYVNSSGGGTAIWNSFFLIPGDKRFLIQNGWTLSYEFLFYAVLGMFLTCRKSLRVMLTSALLLVLSSIGLIFHPSAPILAFATSQLLIEFLLGMLAYLMLRSSWINGRSACAIPIAIVLFAAVDNLHGGNVDVIGYRLLFFGIPSLIFFIGVLGLEGLLRRRRSHFAVRLFVYLGECSFSLYLVHPFVLSGVALVGRRLGTWDEGIASSLVMLILAVGGGVICYRYLEMPLIRVGRRMIMGPPRSPTTGDVANLPASSTRARAGG